MPSRRHPFKQTPRDTRAHAVIEKYLSEHGADSGAQMTIPMPDHQAANEGRLSVNRGARHYDVSASARVTDQDGEHCTYDCADPAAPHALVFALWSREGARAHVFRESGGRPENLRYNPWARR
jgi:hypothetical protein